jgi:pilus assembly protein CpaE
MLKKPIQVHLMTSDPATLELVAGALGGNGQFTLGGSYRDLSALGHGLEREAADFAIVDIDPNPVQTLDALLPFVSQFRETCFIAVLSQLDHELLFRAMHSGVRHVQVRNQLSNELADVLRRIAPRASLAAGQRGSIVTILSASGGCGATTLAVNLANEFHQSTSGRCLIVDLDYSFGTVSTYLELRGQYGVADILEHDGMLDSHLVTTTALRHSDHLYVLASPASINLSVVHHVEPARLRSLLHVCRSSFEFTVVDAPRVPMDVAQALAEESSSIYIALQALVKDIRVAKSIANTLMDHGIQQDRITPLLNRFRKRHQMIGIDEVRKALGSGFAVECVSNDYPSAMRCINYGQLLSEAAPRSLLRHEISQIAHRIVQSSTRNVVAGDAR